MFAAGDPFDLSSKIKIFADGADREEILSLASSPHIKGVTTNPTLMRRAGVENYSVFALDLLTRIPDIPISFEVISDDPDEIFSQAKKIAGWGENVYVKIPITTTNGLSLFDVSKAASSEGVRVNLTAVFTDEQISRAVDAFDSDVPGIVSVFAGRIADAGRDPEQAISHAAQVFATCQNVEVLWASTREVFNITQAIRSGADIITVDASILKKLSTTGKDLGEFSLETVRQFSTDAEAAGFEL